MDNTKWITPIATGAWQPNGLNEANDCTVRALANAKGITYMAARGALERIGRVTGTGVLPVPLTALYRSEGFTVELFGSSTTTEHLSHHLPLGVERNKGITLRSLLKSSKYNKGKHIVGVNGHVFAVVDGCVLDAECTLGATRVNAVYTLSSEHKNNNKYRYVSS